MDVRQYDEFERPYFPPEIRRNRDDREKGLLLQFGLQLPLSSDLNLLFFELRLLQSHLDDQPARSAFPDANCDRLLRSTTRAPQDDLTQVAQAGSRWNDTMTDPRENQQRERSAACDDGRRPGKAPQHFFLPRARNFRPVHESSRGNARSNRTPKKPPLGRLQGT